MAATLLMATGCANEGADSAQADKPAEEKVAASDHDHSGYWCIEHGVPEEVCTRCKPSLAPAFQEKGDWCEKHNRPDSQCFICHPELKEKFAAQYEAKFGKKPPEPTDEG